MTNAPRENALLLLRGLGWERRFPVLVIGEELERGKPDPLPYRTALARLGAAPGHAVARDFDDAALLALLGERANGRTRPG